MAEPVPPAVFLTAEQMRLVLDVARSLAVTLDLDALLRAIANATCELLGCERASIFVHDPAANELWTKVALHAAADIRVPCDRGIVGHAFTANATLHVPDAYRDPRFNPDVDKASGFRTRDLLAAPMVDLDRRPVGVLEALNCCRPDGFGPTDLALVQLLADHAGVAIQRHALHREVVRGAELRREMVLARQVQEELSPTAERLPSVAGVEAAGWTKPASVAGGDCFDLWRLPDGRLGAFLADAAGHGMAPAIVVAQARAVVRAMAEIEPSAGVVLARANARLAADLAPYRFVTAVVAFVDGQTGAVDWASAGHGPILSRPRPGAALELHDPPAPPLGIDADLGACAGTPIRLEPGGELLLVSDGIFEAFDRDERIFGADRVAAAVDAHAGASPADRVLTMRAAVRAWQGHDDPTDDQTVVAVRLVKA